MPKRNHAVKISLTTEEDQALTVYAEAEGIPKALAARKLFRIGLQHVSARNDRVLSVLKVPLDSGDLRADLAYSYIDPSDPDPDPDHPVQRGSSGQGLLLPVEDAYEDDVARVMAAFLGSEPFSRLTVIAQERLARHVVEHWSGLDIERAVSSVAIDWSDMSPQQRAAYTRKASKNGTKRKNLGTRCRLGLKFQWQDQQREKQRNGQGDSRVRRLQAATRRTMEGIDE